MQDCIQLKLINRSLTFMWKNQVIPLTRELQKKLDICAHHVRNSVQLSTGYSIMYTPMKGGKNCPTGVRKKSNVISVSIETSIVHQWYHTKKMFTKEHIPRLLTFSQNTHTIGMMNQHLQNVMWSASCNSLNVTIVITHGTFLNCSSDNVCAK